MFADETLLFYRMYSPGLKPGVTKVTPLQGVFWIIQPNIQLKNSLKFLVASLKISNLN
jgi:hypothetical protein